MFLESCAILFWNTNYANGHEFQIVVDNTNGFASETSSGELLNSEDLISAVMTEIFFWNTNYANGHELDSVGNYTNCFAGETSMDKLSSC
jgi:hypothetical protein